MSISYEIHISCMVKDCAEFNLLICVYCVISILAKIAGFILDPQGLYSILNGAVGILIWLFGIMVYIRCRDGYLGLKSKNIWSNSRYLLAYLALQYLYLLVSCGKVVLFCSKENLGNLISGAILITCLFALVFIYIVLLNFSLARDIKDYNSNPN